MLKQAEKGQAFRAPHERDRAFIIPDPWDAGTARLLAHPGFEIKRLQAYQEARALRRRADSIRLRSSQASGSYIFDPFVSRKQAWPRLFGEHAG